MRPLRFRVACAPVSARPQAHAALMFRLPAANSGWIPTWTLCGKTLRIMPSPVPVVLTPMLKLSTVGKATVIRPENEPPLGMTPPYSVVQTT